MNKSSLYASIHAALIACAAQVAVSAHAAPLDALLSANKPTTPGSAEIEAGYDIMNSTVDVFDIRDRDDDFSGTNVGDYHGGHVRAGVSVTRDLWLEGGLWQRRIDYRQDQAKINTWQVAGQYRLFDAEGGRPAVAVRLGAWGNRADELDKTSPTSFQGVTFNSVHVADPEDRQVQLDLIATWPLQESLEFTTFAGAGTSRVRLDSINGATTLAGCNYNVAFGRDNFIATLAQPCSGGLQRVDGRNSTLGVDVYDEAQYDARYLHAGLSAKWRIGNWQLRGGYQYQYIKRDDVDDIIEQRGGDAVKSNHIFVGELAYRLTANVSLFGRGQYMRNQFAGEIPFAYNTFTAGRFDKDYGFVSVGVMVDF